ncbi:hypothetical protein ACWEQ7_34530 [Streptomyces sp. NPDC004069]
MQQSEHAEQSLVRVDLIVGRPSTEELALLAEGEGAAAEAVADERAELEDAAVMLRRLRAGGDRVLLPVTVINRQEGNPR